MDILLATAPSRKIVQIAACVSESASDSVYALCDDGTLWVLGLEWHRIQPIPQPGDAP